MIKSDVFDSKFAQDIYLQKYSKDGIETWADTSRRVVESVCSQLLDTKTKEKIYQLILARKFIPGGRYLYAAGREFHAVNNCYLFRAEDSREGWADIMHKSTAALMTGGGIGISYSLLRPHGAPIKKTGGVSTGPISHMQMVNEAGRHIMQGGQRRSAIWAGLSWCHPDIFDFMKVKDYSEALKKAKEGDFTFALPMELTNISVEYDTEFFIAIDDPEHPKHSLAKEVWAYNCLHAFSTAEPGMSFNFRKDHENLRNAPVSGGTRVLTSTGYANVGDIVDTQVSVWTGKRWAKTTFKKTKDQSDLVKVSLSNGRQIICDPEHPFIAKNYKGAGDKKSIYTSRINAVFLDEDQKICSDLPLDTIFDDRKIHNVNEYGLGFVFGDGSIKNNRGEISFHCDTKKNAFFLAVDGLNAHFCTLNNRAYFKTALLNKGELLNTKVLSADFISGWFDSDGCYTGRLLRISNSDIRNLHKLQESLDFYGIKSVVRPDGFSSYCPENKIYTLLVLSSSLGLFGSRIPTVRLDLSGERYFKPYRESEIRVVSVEKLDYREAVYCCDVGVEEHSFMAEGVLVSNCTEVVSEDDSDKCNLGTVWINRFKNKREFGEAVKYSVLFLLCGGLYSHTPSAKITETGNRNNRIGLGLGGIHEWLMLQGSDYEVTPELHKWLSVYEQESDSSAFIGAKQLGVNVPKGVRAIAPTGTISILSETTSGIEPLFCKAYRRRYFKDGVWLAQYVVDGSVKRMLSGGVPNDLIKDSYDLSFKQRVKFQADVQNYVDMAISSTCNMPPWGSDTNNGLTLARNSSTLLKYAKRLRGFTAYPDGCRAGQPLTRVSLDEALKQEGVVFEDKEQECVGGVCGI